MLRSHKPLLTIAIAKGRVYQQALPLLEKLDILVTDDPERSRKLVLQTSQPHIRILLIRSKDVPTYVERGGAELGILGRDILLEYQDRGGLYDVLDLGIARCQMVLAEQKQAMPMMSRRPKVATKYPNLTQRYFSKQRLQVDIIKLYGSIELAPILGLSDWIVDLVDTGNTLKANGLAIRQHIEKISARLIINKAAMKVQTKLIYSLVEQLEHNISHDQKI